MRDGFARQRFAVLSRHHIVRTRLFTLLALSLFSRLNRVLFMIIRHVARNLCAHYTPSLTSMARLADTLRRAPRAAAAHHRHRHRHHRWPVAVCVCVWCLCVHDDITAIMRGKPSCEHKHAHTHTYMMRKVSDGTALSMCVCACACGNILHYPLLIGFHRNVAKWMRVIQAQILYYTQPERRRRSRRRRPPKTAAAAPIHAYN